MISVLREEPPPGLPLKKGEGAAVGNIRVATGTAPLLPSTGGGRVGVPDTQEFRFGGVTE
ncbi:hypothetical protein DEVEQU_02219 [Devosia equisanguinis]|uniref:Uncharacterized protein n=1 Tax=Devosia equisanguinis TaxID=2490941 RepID=A0A447IC86_9HYPH|nr:hypothetical protein DEVEQU_02219 [Devosia equisanguinis]